MIKIAFDVDGTLIEKSSNGEDIPKYSTIMLMGMFATCIKDCTIFVWSGSGIDYAQRWVEKLGLEKSVTVVKKGSFIPDIAIDDMNVDLGTINLQV